MNKPRFKLALSALSNHRVWYRKAFWDSDYGWCRFGAGFWMGYLVKALFARNVKEKYLL